MKNSSVTAHSSSQQHLFVLGLVCLLLSTNALFVFERKCLKVEMCCVTDVSAEGLFWLIDSVAGVVIVWVSQNTRYWSY